MATPWVGFYMVQFSIASTTQSTARFIPGSAPLATVVLDDEVPPKKPLIRTPSPTLRPQLEQNRPTSRHGSEAKWRFQFALAVARLPVSTDNREYGWTERQQHLTISK